MREMLTLVEETMSDPSSILEKCEQLNHSREKRFVFLHLTTEISPRRASSSSINTATHNGAIHLNEPAFTDKGVAQQSEEGIGAILSEYGAQWMRFSTKVYGFSQSAPAIINSIAYWWNSIL
eukprot:TRINITY_DN16487_c0_g1_i1.p1 TRINITY_DN16487_c0_g1~~TRINITY_DN16487_c0_g1_i1.p1  ORF type:complete len:122 (-),score=3.42 TRINITY_DN16487_c0_g1_i1:42-407(-)